jgi:hypothetical protein
MGLPRVTLALAASLALALAAGGCATAPERDRPASRDVLRAEEIQAAGGQIRTAYDAVEQLRPHFLRRRATPTIRGSAVDPIVTYLDGIRLGTLRDLATVRADAVVETLRDTLGGSLPVQFLEVERSPQMSMPDASSSDEQVDLAATSTWHHLRG